jgi:DNA ligase 1
MKNFKPMLAVDCGDVNALRFPLFASPKLDGVRAVVMNGGLMSRSLKPIPNVNV